MAEITKEDLIQGATSQPEDAGETDTGSSGSSISDINRFLGNITETLEKVNQLQNRAGGLADNVGPEPKSTPGNTQTPTGETGGKQQQTGLNISGSELFEVVKEAVLQIEQDIGKDATMKELEEYLIENREDIIGTVENYKELMS